MNNSEILAAAIAWLESMIVENPYSDIGIAFSIHDGRIVKTQRTTTVKEKN